MSVTKTVEYELDMGIMLFLCFGENKDVVEIDNTYDVEEVTEDILNESLKSCRSISQTIWYNKMFKEAKGSAESSFPLIALLDS